MKNVMSYALGLFLLASAAQAAPRTLPGTTSQPAAIKAVNAARVKLMNDARKLGPDSPQVQQDKEALINAIEKARNESAGTTRPVNVKRNAKKVKTKSPRKAKKTKHMMAAKTHARKASRKPASRKTSGRKISHRGTRKHARTV